MPWNRPDSLLLVRKKVRAGDLPTDDPRTAECYKFAVASKNGRSVMDIAREWGVSRQALHKRLTRLARWISEGCPANYAGGYHCWRSRQHEEV